MAAHLGGDRDDESVVVTGGGGVGVGDGAETRRQGGRVRAKQLVIALFVAVVLAATVAAVANAFPVPCGRLTWPFC